MTETPTRSGDASSLARAAPIVATLFQIATPVLPLLGIGTFIGTQSGRVGTLLTPAGWAFSIWGALYTGTIVFALYQALPARRGDPLLARLRWSAAGAFVGNGLWALYVQSAALDGVSVAIIVAALACLLDCLRVLAAWQRPFTTGQRWCVALPLGALASWLTVASIVNIAAALRFHGIEGGDATPVIAAAVLVAGGTIAAVALVRTRGNPAFALVFLWALAAIHAAGGQRALPVALAAGAAALLVIGGAFIGLRRGGIGHWFARRRSIPA